MTPYRTLIYLIKRKRKYKKLIIPFSFFILETSLIAMLSLNILGFNIFNFNQRYASEPMVLVRMIHPVELLEKQFKNSETIPFLALNKNTSPMQTFANITSISVALIGMFIALLWMNRFFKLNDINIEWWIWPTGCMASHLLFLTVII